MIEALANYLACVILNTDVQIFHKNSTMTTKIMLLLLNAELMNHWVTAIFYIQPMISTKQHCGVTVQLSRVISFVHVYLFTRDPQHIAPHACSGRFFYPGSPS